MPSANMLAAAACFRPQRILGSTVPSITGCGRPKLDTQPLGITPTAACTRKQHALSSNSSKQQYSRQQCAFSTPCEQKITTRPWQYANTSVLPETVTLDSSAFPATLCPWQQRALGNIVLQATVCPRQQCAFGNMAWTPKPQKAIGSIPTATCPWQQHALGSSALSATVLSAAARPQRQKSNNLLPAAVLLAAACT